MLGGLTNEQMNNILSSQAVGRLACTDGRYPYIVPVTYAYDGNCIYCQTNHGKKLEMMRKNPNVCFAVDVMTDMRNWQSVVVYGKFKELKHEEAKAAREFLFRNIFGLMTSSTVHQYGHEAASQVDDSARIKSIMYRIDIKLKTGRFEKQ